MKALSILTEFLASKNDWRELVKKPWNYNQYTIATDANVLIAIPKIKGFEYFPNGIHSLYLEICRFDFTIKNLDKWKITLPEIAKKPCRLCGGLPVYDCPDCNGFGFIWTKSGYEYSCKLCNETGVTTKNYNNSSPVVCPNCDGKGIKPPNTSVEILGKYYNYELFEKILKLDNVEFYNYKGNKDSALFFSFEEGLGMIMPLANKREKNIVINIEEVK